MRRTARQRRRRPGTAPPLTAAADSSRRPKMAAPATHTFPLPRRPGPPAPLSPAAGPRAASGRPAAVPAPRGCRRRAAAELCRPEGRSPGSPAPPTSWRGRLRRRRRTGRGVGGRRRAGDGRDSCRRPPSLAQRRRSRRSSSPRLLNRPMRGRGAAARDAAYGRRQGPMRDGANGGRGLRRGEGRGHPEAKGAGRVVRREAGGEGSGPGGPGQSCWPRGNEGVEGTLLPLRTCQQLGSGCLRPGRLRLRCRSLLMPGSGKEGNASSPPPQPGKPVAPVNGVIYSFFSSLLFFHFACEQISRSTSWFLSSDLK